MMRDLHPASTIFPVMAQDELVELAEDIRKRGQQEPVVLFDGAVLDGRNRLIACELAKVKPKYRTLEECDDPVAWVISANLRRRHLDVSQRAMVAAKSAIVYEKLAKERQLSGTLPAMAGKGEAVDRAGDAVGVSGDSVARAKTVLEHGSRSLVAAVERGDVSVRAASEVARLPKKQQRELLDVEDKKAAAAERAKALRRKKAETAAAERDAEGNAVPEHLASLFRLRPRWAAIDRAIREATRGIHDLRGELAKIKNTSISLGSLLSAIPRLEKAHIDVAISIPHAVCAYCKGEEPYCERPGGKQDCGGWANKGAWKSSPERLKKPGSGRWSPPPRPEVQVR